LLPVAAKGPGIIQILQYGSVPAEAAGVAAFIDDQINNHGRQPGEILLLAQRRVIGNPIHDALRGRGIPSKSYYQESELESAAAQERLAVFKLFINREDRIALRWLLGLGSHDFRAGAYARVRAYCEKAGEPPWGAMCKLAGGELALPHCRHLVDRFHAVQNELRFLEEHGDVQDLVARWLRAEFAGAGELRLLVAGILPNAESPADLLLKIMEAVSQPEIPPDVTEVRVMSLHKSKGLSSPVVVIAGCIDGLLPAEPDRGTPAVQRLAILEEQRRLFYVGITRVKADPNSNRPGVLLLTGSRVMTLADAMQSNIRPAVNHYGEVYVHMSRFIPELGNAAPAPRAG
jgi:ATP-dependent DNA helicase UvrD/PcrA